MATIHGYIRLSVLIILISIFGIGYTKTKTVSCEYLYHVPENVTTEQAKETAITRARIQAISDEFGSYVMQTSSIKVDNNNGDSSINFMSLGGSELKGEWIEDLEEPIFEYLTDGNNIAIKVKIKGKIREIEGTRTPLSIKLLRNDIHDTEGTDRFISGDELYMTFISPVEGYLAVYLLDTEDTAYCLLPYHTQQDGIYKIKANKKYIFFNPEYKDETDSMEIDSIILETNRDYECNRIFAIFSPNKFYKGIDYMKEQDTPRCMSFSNFKTWFSDIRKKDKDLTIQEIPIHISSKE